MTKRRAFELPTSVPTSSDDVLCDANGVAIAEFSSRAYAKFASHKINSADKLAESLDKAISLLSYPATVRLLHEQELRETLDAYMGGL